MRSCAHALWETRTESNTRFPLIVLLSYQNHRVPPNYNTTQHNLTYFRLSFANISTLVLLYLCVFWSFWVTCARCRTARTRARSRSGCSIRCSRCCPTSCRTTRSPSLSRRKKSHREQIGRMSLRLLMMWMMWLSDRPRAIRM